VLWLRVRRFPGWNVQTSEICNIISGMKENWKIILGLTAFFVVGALLNYSPVPMSVTENYRKVERAYLAGDDRARAAALLELAEELPWRRNLPAAAGKAAYQAGDLALAEKALERAAQENSLTPAGKLLLGDVYLAAGNAQQAEDIWRELPGEPSSHRKLADLYFVQGNFSGAVNQWQEYRQSSEAELSLEEQRSVGLLLAVEDPPKSLPYLEAASREYPDAGGILRAVEGNLEEEPAYRAVVTGQALGAYDHWQLAVGAFEKAVNFRPDYVEAWAYLGEALQHVSEPGRDPLQTLEKARNLEEDSPLANMFLGLYWQRQGSHRTALEYFQQTADAWGDRPDVYVEQGRSLAALGELEEALTKYQQAVALSDGSGTYYSRLATFTVEYKYQLKEVGLPAARAAIDLAGQTPEVLTVMGEVLLALDDPSSAWKFFSRAVEEDQTFAPAHFQLAILYSVEGEDAGAGYHIEQALAFAENSALRERARTLQASLDS